MSGITYALMALAAANASFASETLDPKPTSVYATAAPLTAHCTAEVAPDVAVIVGALIARTLKPTEARSQLERQIEAVRSYVHERGGQLALGETVRAARSGPPPDGQGGDQPFIRVQRLEAVFSTQIAIDDVLEGLLQLGLEQFGRDVTLDGLDSRPRVVVRYRFRTLGSTLEALQRQCREATWRTWRQDEIGETVDQGSIVSPPAGCRLRSLAFAVRSQPVLSEHGGSVPLELQHPWAPAQVDGLEMLGHAPLRLQGTLTATVEGCLPK
jgi:hypothetical protein